MSYINAKAMKLILRDVLEVYNYVPLHETWLQTFFNNEFPMVHFEIFIRNRIFFSNFILKKLTKRNYNKKNMHVSKWHENHKIYTF